MNCIKENNSESLSFSFIFNIFPQITVIYIPFDACFHFFNWYLNLPKKQFTLHAYFFIYKSVFHSAKIAKSKQYHVALKTHYVILDFSGFLRQACYVTVDFIHLILTKVPFNFYSKLCQILVNGL